MMAIYGMRPAEAAWTVLRWLFALFFFAMGIWIAIGVLPGLASRIVQPTAAAAALDAAFQQSGIIDPPVAASYVFGGAALAFRRTAPLGLVLLAPAVTIILLFDVVLAKLPVPGLTVAAIWAMLALRHLSAFRSLWTFGQDDQSTSVKT